MAEESTNPTPPAASDDVTVCLCFHVSERKVVNYCRREKPAVASLISECLSAGTGCGWCVPFLKELHRQVRDGVSEPGLRINPGEYASQRADYRKSGQRS